MSGHNKWTQIKRKKEITDKKRSQMFSKFLRAISVTAHGDPNPSTNSLLRAAINRARENNVPQENIDRAIKKSNETTNLERLILEGYGPGGIALVITATTNNKNRTVAEIKKIITDHHGKWADPGSVLWAFTQTNGEWGARFPQIVPENIATDLAQLIDALDDHNDVDDIYTTARTETPHE